MTARKGTTKKEWLEMQPDGQKRAEQIRVSRYPHVVNEVSVVRENKRTGLSFVDRSICTVVKPHKHSAQKKIIKPKKAVKK